MPLVAKKPKRILYQTALDLMRLPGSRLMMMHHPSLEEGIGYFVVSSGKNKGGMLDQKDAEKLISRPDVNASGDGLFPGSTQSWFLGCSD